MQLKLLFLASSYFECNTCSPRKLDLIVPVIFRHGSVDNSI